MEGCAVPIALGVIILGVMVNVWVVKALIAWPNASFVICVLLVGALLARVTADY